MKIISFITLCLVYKMFSFSGFQCIKDKGTTIHILRVGNVSTESAILLVSSATESKIHFC